MTVSKLSEASRLHDLGFGVHWIRPSSKVPVKGGWTDKERDPLVILKKEYQKGYGIGTKLGTPSQVGEGYLAVIDVDVKGSDTRHQKQALAWLNEHLPGLYEKCPITLSGRGNGSMHLWVLVEEPVPPRKIYASNELIEVYMPSVQPSKKDIEKLGKKKCDQGYRSRPAFEIDFMCEGRQVVLPPSIHPDSGKEYKWKRPINSPWDLEVIDPDKVFGDMKASKAGRPMGSASKTELIKIEDLTELDLEMGLPPEMVDGIVEGEDVLDRSAYCLSIALTMVQRKFTDAQILGVLTNREWFIGSVAFEHAKTTHRQRAARWAYDYCVRKARQEADASEIFKAEVKEYDTLTEEQVEERVTSKIVDLGQVDWRKLLDRTDNDKVKPTFKNVKLILYHVVSPAVFKHNMFSNWDYVGCDTPWGSKEGESITDTTLIQIKSWLANSQWKIEPSVNVINEAVIDLAYDNSYHPVKEYLEELEWDGVARINTWMSDYLGAKGNEDYLCAVSRKFLVAAVARIYQPGVKFDYMPIFEGDQGVGKSTAGRILASDAWFYDSDLNLHDKDSALNIQGQWMIEMGELANISRADVRTIKSFITRQVDKVRPPYGKKMIESARQCVFFGTTNDDSYLKDKTGNRRFWPIETTGMVDLAGLREVRDQLWAEAMWVYDNTEETLYLSKDVEKLAKDIQQTRVIEDVSDVMLEKLTDWWGQVAKARKNKKLDKVPMKFKLYDLFGEFSSEEDDMNLPPPLKEFRPDNNLHLQWAAFCLKKLGFFKIKIQGVYWWRNPKL